MQELEQYFEDYNVGDKRTTPGRTITETDIVMHAMHSGDFFPHHVDAEFAKKGPFGKSCTVQSHPFSWYWINCWSDQSQSIYLWF